MVIFFLADEEAEDFVAGAGDLLDLAVDFFDALMLVKEECGYLRMQRKP